MDLNSNCKCPFLSSSWPSPFLPHIHTSTSYFLSLRKPRILSFLQRSVGVRAATSGIGGTPCSVCWGQWKNQHWGPNIAPLSSLLSPLSFYFYHVPPPFSDTPPFCHSLILASLNLSPLCLFGVRSSFPPALFFYTKHSKLIAEVVLGRSNCIKPRVQAAWGLFALLRGPTCQRTLQVTVTPSNICLKPGS